VSGEPILTTLLIHLKSRRLLLLLDNFGHLLDASAGLADGLHHAGPELRMPRRTGRGLLRLYGEASYHVPSLSAPDPRVTCSLEALEHYESVRLLRERARLVSSDFALTEQNAAAASEICWRLDGIPLEVELEAARPRGLTVEQTAARLDDRFRLLTAGSRTTLRRQQMLRATIDWSNALLSAPERVLFRRLAVFSGAGASRLSRRCARALATKRELMMATSSTSCSGWSIGR